MRWWWWGRGGTGDSYAGDWSGVEVGVCFFEGGGGGGVGLVVVLGEVLRWAVRGFEICGWFGGRFVDDRDRERLLFGCFLARSTSGFWGGLFGGWVGWGFLFGLGVGGVVVDSPLGRVVGGWFAFHVGGFLRRERLVVPRLDYVFVVGVDCG